MVYLCPQCHACQVKPGLCATCKRVDNQRRNRKTAEQGRSSSAWRRFRKANIASQCQRCGSGDNLTYHYRPGGRHSFNPGDYQTLCRSCHGSIDAPRAHYTNH